MWSWPSGESYLFNSGARKTKMDFTTILNKKVSDVMTREVIVLGQGEPVSKAARLMLENRVHGLVITKDDKPVKVLTSFDMLRVAYFDFLDDDPDFLTLPVDELLAGQTELVSLRPDQSLGEALEVFTRRNIRTLPVLDQSGDLVGILSLMDLAGSLEEYRAQKD